MSANAGLRESARQFLRTWRALGEFDPVSRLHDYRAALALCRMAEDDLARRLAGYGAPHFYCGWRFSLRGDRVSFRRVPWYSKARRALA